MKDSSCGKRIILAIFSQKTKRAVSYILFIFFIFPLVAFASTTDGTIDSVSKYAWGNQIGWLNFGTTGGNVHVTDAALTGYVWSQNYGWINLNPTQGG